jgi:hypothetical protein
VESDSSVVLGDLLMGEEEGSLSTRVSEDILSQPNNRAEETKGDCVWKRTKGGRVIRLIPTGVTVSPSSGWTTRGTGGAY